MLDITPWKELLGKFKEDTPYKIKKEAALKYYDLAVKKSPEFTKLSQSEQNETLYGILKTINPQKPERPLSEKLLQIPKEIGGAAAKMGAGFVSGATLGIVEPEEGTVNIPFTSKKYQVAAPLSFALEQYGVDPSIAENPFLGVIPKLLGVGKAWQTVGAGVEKALTKIPELTAPVADLTRKALPGVVEATKAAFKTIPEGTLTAVGRVAKATTTGAVVGAAIPRTEEESLLRNAFVYGSIAGTMQLTTELAAPIANFIKNSVKYKTQVKNITADDLFNALNGTGRETAEAKAFVHKLTAPERKDILDQMLQEAKTTGVRPDIKATFNIERANPKNIVSVKSYNLASKQQQTLTNFLINKIKDEGGTFRPTILIEAFAKAGEQKILPVEQAQTLIKEHAFSLLIPVLNRLRKEGRLSPEQLIRVPITDKNFVAKTKNPKLDLETTIIDAFKKPTEAKIHTGIWGTIEDFSEQPEVFKELPWLKNIQVDIRTDVNFDGQWSGKTLTVNGKLPIIRFKEVLLHEQQHIIEHSYATAIFYGSSITMRPYAKQWSNIHSEMQRILGKTYIQDSDMKQLQKLELVREELLHRAFQDYRKVFGEMFSRYVSEAGYLNQEQLEARSPLSSKSTMNIQDEEITVSPSAATEVSMSIEEDISKKMLEVIHESPEELKLDLDLYNKLPDKHQIVNAIIEDKIKQHIDMVIIYAKKYVESLIANDTTKSKKYSEIATIEEGKAKKNAMAFLRLKNPVVDNLVNQQLNRLEQAIKNPEILAEEAEMSIEEPKAPYLQTRQEYFADRVGTSEEESALFKHQESVTTVLSQGKEIPPEVLKDYPQLRVYERGQALPAEAETFRTPRELEIIQTSDIIYSLTKENGGATINPRTNENLVGKQGYAVAVYPKNGKIVEELTPQIIQDFITNNKSIFSKDKQAMVGTWVNEGKTYLDIIKVIPNQEEALKIGQEYKQKAIFDLQKLEEIIVPEKPIRGISTERLLGTQKKAKLTIEEIKALKIKLRAERDAAKTGFIAGKKEIKEAAKANLAEDELNKQLQYLFNVDRKIAVPYQRLILQLTKNISLKNFNRDAILKTKQWFESIDPEQVGLHPDTTNKIKNTFSLLDKKMLSELTLEEKQSIINSLQRLQAQGKLMYKIQLILKEKDRKELQDKVIIQTKNLDGKASLGHEAGKEVYLNFLTPYRVADKMDDFKIGGMLKEFIVQEAFGEINSDYNAGIQFTDYINKAMTIKPDWSEEELKHIVLKGLDIMGATTQRDILLEEMGLVSVPELTPAENALLLLTEETMNQNKHNIASVYEARENKIFPEIPRYIFALKYPAQTNIVDSNLIRQDFHMTKDVNDYFTESRQKGVKKLIRTDLFSMVKDTLFEQNWYFHMQPILDTQSSVIFTKAFKAKAGTVNYTWWKNQIDIVSRRGYSAKADTIFNKTDQLLKAGRVNLINATLAYKLSSALAQVYSTSDAMVLALTLGRPDIASKIIPNVLKAYMQKDRPAIYKLSKALQERTGGEQALEELFNKTNLGNFAKKGYALLKEVDLRTAIGVQQAFYDTLQGKVSDPLKEAEIYTLLSQAGGGVVFRPHILATGEKAKTLLTLQTFFLNRWGLVAHDIIDKNIIHGSTKQKILGAAAIALIITTSLLEDKFRESLHQLITNKPPAKDIPQHKKIAGAFLEIIPIVGRVLNNLVQGKPQQISEVPIIRITYKGVKSIKDIFTKEEYEAKMQAIITSLETYITLKYGTAGTAQFFDILDRFLPETKAQQKRRITDLKRQYKEALQSKDKKRQAQIMQEYYKILKNK